MSNIGKIEIKPDLQCILCRYRKDIEKCVKVQHNPTWHCPTLLNIYYGKVIKHQPFKAVQNIIDEINYKKDKDYYDTFNDDYTENEDIKLIFGVVSYDDLTSNTPNLLTMNDLDVIYDKHNNTYSWSVEYIYSFKTIDSKKQYVKRLLDIFTKFMKENGYDTELDGFYTIFANATEFDTLEECYANFKYCVNGYINS